jgi:hypothetical protein
MHLRSYLLFNVSNDNTLSSVRQYCTYLVRRGFVGFWKVVLLHYVHGTLQHIQILKWLPILRKTPAW